MYFCPKTNTIMKGQEVAVYIMGMIAVVMILMLLLQMYMGK